jgi:DNA helicase-2/ATP-dependent DNA helicase PcrA
MDLLAGLNDAQKEAVLQTDGPVMIIAGAGSGKTRVLTYRIAYLLHKGIDPFAILALTFTNKAAKEMRNRIEELVGSPARSLMMGTFHSVFAKILRAEAHHIGYTPGFTIYDTDDSKSLIKSIVKELSLDDKLYKPSTVLHRISQAKNNLVSVREYLANPETQQIDREGQRPALGQLYKTYQERLFKSGAMDFDDLLFNTNVLFRDHLDVLNKYQVRFQYTMVDEFQDTNLSQYLITRKLSARNQNICVVGDDAQSIYAFRGANIQNILNFEKDYPDLRVYKLEQNYRSTSNIVETANAIISKNKQQLRKQVWTGNEQGPLIEVLKSNSDNEEGKLVATTIFEEKMRENLRNKDFAILYRTNAQSRAMEEALRRLNIRYKVIGGLSFYQRKEVKDLLGYLRFVTNSNDEEALKRIINLPKRGIGDSTVNRLIVFADEQGISLWEALQYADKAVAGRSAVPVLEFVQLIKRFKIASAQKDAFEASMEIAKSSGLLKELYDDKSIEGVARYENVQALLNGIKEFVANPDNGEAPLAAYLQEIALITDADTKDSTEDDSVTLMTIHSAKGLEFRNVFVVGMEEDLFPSQMMISSREDLEEERRLFYVAVTRAEKKLTLSYAVTRYVFGRLKACEPSRFLLDLEPKYLKSARIFEKNEEVEQFERVFRFKAKPVAASSAKNTHTPTDGFSPSDNGLLKVGHRVEHPKFGFGTVVELDTSGSDRKARILFEQAGEKTLLLSFAKLMIHNALVP